MSGKIRVKRPQGLQRCHVQSLNLLRRVCASPEPRKSLSAPGRPILDRYHSRSTFEVACSGETRLERPFVPSLPSISMARQDRAATPKVFISSTAEDLKSHRQAARDAAETAGFQIRMMESFAAGGNPPLQECLREVAGCDLVVAIVAHRYGWVPDEQPGEEHKSITWLECEHAERSEPKTEVLAFLVDPTLDWPEALKEHSRLTGAMAAGAATPKLFHEVSRNVERLAKFKEWLSNGRVRKRSQPKPI